MSDSEHDWLRPEEETESETIIDARTAQNNPEVADVVASRRPITSVNMPRSSVCIALPTKPDWIRKSPKCTANSW